MNSRELDKVIAVTMMGWTKSPLPGLFLPPAGSMYPQEPREVPEFSTSFQMLPALLNKIAARFPRYQTTMTVYDGMVQVSIGYARIEARGGWERMPEMVSALLMRIIRAGALDEFSEPVENTPASRQYREGFSGEEEEGQP